VNRKILYKYCITPLTSYFFLALIYQLVRFNLIYNCVNVFLNLARLCKTALITFLLYAFFLEKYYKAIYKPFF